MHPKFHLTGVLTHDLQIMTVLFNVTETPALITCPSVTSQTFKTVIVNSDERLLWE